MNRTEAVLRPRRFGVNQSEDRPTFTPGEDPTEFGRRAARDLFKRHIQSSDDKPSEEKKDEG